MRHSDTKFIKKSTVDQNLEGARACWRCLEVPLLRVIISKFGRLFKLEFGVPNGMCCLLSSLCTPVSITSSLYHFLYKHLKEIYTFDDFPIMKELRFL